MPVIFFSQVTSSIPYLAVDYLHYITDVLCQFTFLCLILKTVGASANSWELQCWLNFKKSGFWYGNLGCSWSLLIVLHDNRRKDLDPSWVVRTDPGTTCKYWEDGFRENVEFRLSSSDHSQWRDTKLSLIWAGCCLERKWILDLWVKEQC